MVKRELHLDVAGAVSEFEELMKEFVARRTIYKLIFRGKGLEFDSYRDYSPDDDAGDIDWKASMRGNKLLVRQYVEERDLSILFVVDVGDNMVLGSSQKLKCEYAVEVCAALSYLMANSGDKVGFVLFNKEIKKFVPPAPGLRQFYLFVDELSKPENYGGESKVKETLDYLINNLDDSISAVVLVSDFVKVKPDEDKSFDSFGGRFETMAIMIKDLLDMTFPKTDEEVILENPVNGEQMIVSPSVAKKIYEKNALEQEEGVEKIFSDADIDSVILKTDEKFPFPLSEFLKGRVERNRYIIPKH